MIKRKEQGNHNTTKGRDEKMKTEQEEKMDANKKGELLDTKQLADQLGIKQGWIRQNMKKIPHFKMGRLVRFDPKAVMEQFKKK